MRDRGLSARCRTRGGVIMSDKPMVRFFWRAFDRLDYWLTQARLWLADAVCGPRLNGDPLD